MAAIDTRGPTALAMASSAEQATKEFGEGSTSVRALDGIDVAFETGRFSAIMGPSGSGKSTLLHCLAALEPLTSGRAFIGGTDLSDLDDTELTVLRRDRIGFVFQTFNLVPTLSAEKNIMLQRRLARQSVDQEWYDTVIESLQLRDRLHHRPSELSGGQQQRVAVARALINRPEIIFADEPTGNLDSASGHEVLGFLRRAVDDFGQTVVMVTHDPGAAGYAERVGFLEDGAIVDDTADPTTSRVLEKLGEMGP
ncbi:MAG: ABC transporter ATP-binding protein [Acidimicrobiales bacterium]